jgi:adenosine deaminase
MAMMLTRELIARLPKAELHVHLDGSLRPATMLELAAGAGVRLPANDADTLRRVMLAEGARHLEDYLRGFDITVALLQTEEAIERVAYEMVADAARENVRYLEVRYCPVLSHAGGLSLDAITAAELEGLARGEAEFGVVARAIHCSLRHLPPALSEEIARHAVAWRERGVVGFDLAGGEAGQPASLHRRAFEIAEEGGLGITVHAGEAAGAESVAEAVHRCRANRLGHGTRLQEDSALQDYVRDRRIHVEINLTSNLQTHVVARAEEHPVRRYVDAGLSVSLSSDNWLMSGTTITDEYWLAHRALRFTREEIDRMILDGVAAAFLPWPARRALLERIRTELGAIR